MRVRPRAFHRVMLDALAAFFLAAANLFAPPVVGEYHAPHAVRYVCERGWCHDTATDRMTITAAGDGGIDAYIELFQTNGHTCEFAGTLAPDPTSSARWIHRSDDPDEGACTLTLHRTRHRLELRADGCRLYCGARASLDASFPIRPR